MERKIIRILFNYVSYFLLNFILDEKVMQSAGGGGGDPHFKFAFFYFFRFISVDDGSFDTAHQGKFLNINRKDLICTTPL